MSEMVTPCHQIQRKRRKKLNDYSQKSIDDFELVLVTPSPKLTDQEKRCVRNSFDASSQYQCIETNSKIILTHVLRRWDENRSNAHPSTSSLTPDETVALKIYSIEPKHSSWFPVPFCINHRQPTDLPLSISEITGLGISHMPSDYPDEVYLCQNIAVYCLLLTY